MYEHRTRDKICSNFTVKSDKNIFGWKISYAYSNVSFLGLVRMSVVSDICHTKEKTKLSKQTKN